MATPVSPGTTLCSVAEDEKLLAAKWDFESSDGLAMKKCAILAEPGHGNCLKLLAPASRATVKTTAMLPDIASLKTPYTLAIWLKPDKSVISDADVEMAKLGGRRMTKFASAMHDGKWHHLDVTYDPARTNAEYDAYVDWPYEKSPWRFMSFYEKDTGMSKCILPIVAGKRGNARGYPPSRRRVAKRCPSRGAKGLCVKKGTMQIKWREE